VPHFEDLGVAPKPGDVGLERPDLPSRLERVAEEITKRREQPAGHERLVDGKGGDGVARI
jgi:hypothetical protein